MNLCPQTKEDCQEGSCALWVKMNVTTDNPDEKKEQGRCSIAWIPILLVELRVAIEQRIGQVPNNG